MRKLIALVSFVLLCFSCQPDLDYSIRGFTEKIIVEGSIGNGEYPRVYLSLNVPLWQQLDSALILEKVIRTAKVSVSDGEKSEILTSRWDKGHFPPYVYRGTEMKGEEGKNYFLKVEYSGYTLHAKTTIPKITRVMGFSTKPSAINDSLRHLSTTVLVDSSEFTGFRLFSKKLKDGEFFETPTVYNANFNLSGLQQFEIKPNPKEGSASFDEQQYFLKGDSTIVKICSIDSFSTVFFEELLLKSGFRIDVFISESQGLKTNVSSPGFGIWYGYDVQNHLVVID
jgi:hypothetical protein